MAAGGKEKDDDEEDTTAGGTAASAWGFGPVAPRPAVDAQNDEEVDNTDEEILADAAALGILLAGDTVTAKSTGLFWLWSVCRRLAFLRFFKRATPRFAP